MYEMKWNENEQTKFEIMKHFHNVIKLSKFSIRSSSL